MTSRGLKQMGSWNRNRTILHLPGAFLVDMDDTLLTYSEASAGAWRAVCTKYAAQACGAADPDLLHAAISAAGRRYWEDPERHRMGRLNLLMARREVVTLALAALNRKKILQSADPMHEASLDGIVRQMMPAAFDLGHIQGISAGLVKNPLADSMADDYSVLQHEWLDWFPDAEKTLEQLRKDRVRLVLATNGQASLQRAKINRFHMDRFFEMFLIEGEMGFGKPDPRVYQKALAGLALKSDEVMMIGDNLLWDVKGAQDAGMKACWVDFRGTGLPEGSLVRPDRILSSISDLYGRGS